MEVVSVCGACPYLQQPAPAPEPAPTAIQTIPGTQIDEYEGVETVPETEGIQDIDEVAIRVAEA